MSIEMQERAKTIIAEMLSVDIAEIKAESHLVNDLGGDSLDAIELVMALEDEFETEIPEEDASNIHTVGDIFNWLEANIKS